MFSWVVALFRFALLIFVFVARTHRRLASPRGLTLCGKLRILIMRDDSRHPIFSRYDVDNDEMTLHAFRSDSNQERAKSGAQF